MSFTTFMLAAIKRNHQLMKLLKKVTTEVTKDNQKITQLITLTALQQNGDLFSSLDEEDQNNKDLITAALSQNIQTVTSIDKKHRDLVHDIISNNTEIKKNLSSLSNTKDVLPIIQTDWRLFEFINSEFQDWSTSNLFITGPLIATAVEQNRTALDFVTGDLKNSFDNIITNRIFNDQSLFSDELKKNGLLLKFVVDDKLKNDIQFVTTAILQNPEAIKYAGAAIQNSFQGNDDKILLSQITNSDNLKILLSVKPSLLTNKPFMLKMVRCNGLALEFAGMEKIHDFRTTKTIAYQLSGDPHIVQAAITNNLDAAKFISVVSASEVDSAALEMITNDNFKRLQRNSYKRISSNSKSPLDQDKYYYITNDSTNIDDHSVGYWLDGKWETKKIADILGFNLQSSGIKLEAEKIKKPHESSPNPNTERYQIIIAGTVNSNNYDTVIRKTKTNLTQEISKEKINLKSRTSSVIEDQTTKSILQLIEKQPGFLTLVLDRKIVETAIKKNGRLLGLVNKKFTNHTYHLHHKQLKTNGGIDIIVAAIKQNNSVLQLVNTDIVQVSDDDYLEIISSTLQNTSSVELLNFIKWERLNRQKIINSNFLEQRIAPILRNNGLALEYIAMHLKAYASIQDELADTVKQVYKKLVLTAVTQNGLALQFTEDFRKDEEVIKVALNQNRQASKYIHESLHQQPDITALHERKTGVDFIFDQATIKWIMSPQDQYKIIKNNLIEELCQILIEYDNEAFKNFITQCKKYATRENNNNNININIIKPNNLSLNYNEDNFSNKNITYYEKLSECMTKLRNRWIELERSTNIYAQQQELQQLNDQLKNAIQIELKDLDSLLKQVTKKTLEEYLQTINKYIKYVEHTCREAYQQINNKTGDAQKNFSKYIVFKNSASIAKKLGKQQPTSNSSSVPQQKVKSKLKWQRCSAMELNKKPHFPENQFYYDPDKKLTLLETAVNEGNLNAVALLLELGADIFLQQEEAGHNAISLALKATISALSKTASTRENANKVLSQVVENFATRISVFVDQPYIKEHLKEINRLMPVLKEYVTTYCKDIRRNFLLKILFLGWHYDKVMEQQCNYINAITQALELGVKDVDLDKTQKILTEKFCCEDNSSRWDRLHKINKRATTLAKEIIKYVIQQEKNIKNHKKQYQELMINHVPEKFTGNETTKIYHVEENKHEGIVQPKENEQTLTKEIIIETEPEVQKKEPERKLEDIKEDKPENKEPEHKLEDVKEINQAKKELEYKLEDIKEIKLEEKKPERKLEDVKELKLEEKIPERKLEDVKEVKQEEKNPEHKLEDVKVVKQENKIPERKLEDAKDEIQKKNIQQSTTTTKTNVSTQVLNLLKEEKEQRRKTMLKPKQEEKMSERKLEDKKEINQKKVMRRSTTKTNNKSATQALGFLNENRSSILKTVLKESIKNEEKKPEYKFEDVKEINQKEVTRQLPTETNKKPNQIPSFLSENRKKSIARLKEMQKKEEMRRNESTKSDNDNPQATNINRSLSKQ